MYRDQYFLQKLVGLHADDGFLMNPVLISVFNLMGVWPLIYTMLLIPSGRGSKGSPPVWPFAAVSFATGAFALLPYFALWRGEGPPPLPSARERDSWPVKILESKVTAVSAVVGAAVLLTYAATAGGPAWKEYDQYFRESQFVHVMSLDFLILASLAPFWLFNDMTVRKWRGKGDWWWPLLAVLPVLGPAIYLLLRPPLPEQEE